MDDREDMEITNLYKNVRRETFAHTFEDFIRRQPSICDDCELNTYKNTSGKEVVPFKSNHSDQQPSPTAFLWNTKFNAYYKITMSTTKRKDKRIDEPPSVLRKDWFR